MTKIIRNISDRVFSVIIQTVEFSRCKFGPSYIRKLFRYCL